MAATWIVSIVHMSPNDGGIILQLTFKLNGIWKKKNNRLKPWEDLLRKDSLLKYGNGKVYFMWNKWKGWEGTVYVRKIWTCMASHKPEGEAWRKQLQDCEMKENRTHYPGTTSDPVTRWLIWTGKTESRRKPSQTSDENPTPLKTKHLKNYWIACWKFNLTKKDRGLKWLIALAYFWLYKNLFWEKWQWKEP